MKFYWKRSLDWSFASNICRAIAKPIAVCFSSWFLFGQSLDTVPTIPSAGHYGQTRESDQDPWSPLWTTLLPTAKSCMKLIECGQDKWCRGQCKWIKADLACTALCACDGLCVRIKNANSFSRVVIKIIKCTRSSLTNSRSFGVPPVQ